MADTANVESRKLEDRPLGQEESRKKTWRIPRTLKVVNQRADLKIRRIQKKERGGYPNVESRESDDRPHEGGVQKSGKGGPPVSWELSLEASRD